MQDVSYSAGGDMEFQIIADLAPTPRGVLLTKLYHFGFQRGLSKAGTDDWPPRSLLQPLPPLRFVALEPLVARFRADAEASAQFSFIAAGLPGQGNEPPRAQLVTSEYRHPCTATITRGLALS